MSKTTVYIKKLVLIALLGASLNAFKICLMLIPNVEVVTLLIVVYTYVFGMKTGMGATLVFCVTEGFLWGFDPSWLIAYFIHWPTVCVVAFLIKKSNLKNPLITASIITAVTAMFGFQSTFTYFLTGGAVGTANWLVRYWAMYYSGIVYYAVQCASSLVSISIGFKPMCDLLTKLGGKYFGYSKYGL